MPLVRRVGRPGLIGTAARTAVIAGTASATANAVGRHQQNKWAQQQADAQSQAAAEQARLDAAAQQAVAQAQAAPPAPVAAAPAAGGDDLISKIQELAQLQAAGVLTPEEFTAAKAKLLS